MKMRDLIIAVLATICLAATLFIAIPPVLANPIEQTEIAYDDGERDAYCFPAFEDGYNYIAVLFTLSKPTARLVKARFCLRNTSDLSTPYPFDVVVLSDSLQELSRFSVLVPPVAEPWFWFDVNISSPVTVYGNFYIVMHWTIETPNENPQVTLCVDWDDPDHDRGYYGPPHHLIPGWDFMIRAVVEYEHIILSKTIVGQTFSVFINVNIYHIENFNVTVYYNDTVIGEQTLIPENGTITFSWNTTGVPYGNYTIKAIADKVPGEIMGGWVFVTIPGDINGDRTVDMTDLGWIAYSYGATPSHSKWNPNRDITGDDLIDMTDLGIACMHYGETCP